MKLKQSFINTFPDAYEAITSVTGVTPKGRAQGVDVYGPYQGYFRPEIATQRIDFAIQKLTEGITIVDPKRDEIWSGVKQIGMRGAYHYQRSGVSWLAQADKFLEIASKYDHHFIVNDIEKINNVVTINNKPNYSFFADMFRILNHWKEQSPSKRVVLYSNFDLFNNFIYPAIKQLYGDLGVKWLTEEIDIWYAQYWNTPSVDKDPSLPLWMETWRIWQITDTALKPLMGSDWGMQSLDGDINVYNGTPDQMRAWLGLTSQPPVEPEPIPVPVPAPIEPIPEPKLYDAEVTSDTRVLVRSYPRVRDDTKTGFYVYLHNKFQGRIWAGNGYVWLKIDAPQYPDIDKKWVAVRTIDSSARYIRLMNPPVISPTPLSLYRVRRWGDPVLVREGGLSVSIVGTSNFQAVGLYNKLTGWGGVSNHLTIPRSDITKLMALQVEDEYQDKRPDTWREQKMNWLCKPRGTIYFTKDGPSWPTADRIMWGTIALGHNLVQVEGVEDMTISTPNDSKERSRKMARLVGFRKTDWVRPLVELVARGLVHRCYCAYSGDDIGDSPKGIVYSPFWSPMDWDFAGNARPQAFYLPMDWLEAV